MVILHELFNWPKKTEFAYSLEVQICQKKKCIFRALMDNFLMEEEQNIEIITKIINQFQIKAEVQH